MTYARFDHDGLSPAELSAARLDGELVAVGDAYVPADALETPTLRAATLRGILGGSLVAIGLTAAWVHGASGVPPRVHHAQRTAARGVARPVDRRIRFRDTPIAVEDTVLLGGVRVSDPARTLVDLVREFHDPDSAAAARRLATPPLIEQALAWIDAHRRFGGRRPAAEILRSLRGDPPATTT
ncbi:SAM-dependent methyltransferase [Microbacterium lacusdiani]